MYQDCTHQLGDMALTVSERKAMLRRRRGLQVRVATKLGVDPGDVSRVVNELDALRVSPATARRIRAEIAKRIGLPVREAFPPRVAGAAVDPAL